MTWHMIRLDLARSETYPNGSHEHCYLLRLPLDERGRIDPAAARADPRQATVLRSRPDEPEQAGHLGRRDGGWVFSYAPGDGDDEALFHLETHPLRPGDFITIIDRNGEAQCFEVSSCEPLAESHRMIA